MVIILYMYIKKLLNFAKIQRNRATLFGENTQTTVS